MNGKAYLDVQYRVLWMREEHPDWSIETEFLTLGADVAVAKATVRDAGGKVLSQGTKQETPLTFKKGYVEKAETGAIGRALGFAGYGTQFALDLDEADENGNDNPVIADSPVQAHAATLDDYVLTFGKFNGRSLGSIDATEIRGYFEWLKKNQKPGDKDSEGMQKIAAYVASRTPRVVSK